MPITYVLIKYAGCHLGVSSQVSLSIEHGHVTIVPSTVYRSDLNGLWHVRFSYLLLNYHVTAMHSDTQTNLLKQTSKGQNDFSHAKDKNYNNLSFLNLSALVHL